MRCASICDAQEVSRLPVFSKGSVLCRHAAGGGPDSPGRCITSSESGLSFDSSCSDGNISRVFEIIAAILSPDGIHGGGYVFNEHKVSLPRNRKFVFNFSFFS
jgi:hypothetical protein